jgi:hypothetical protein
LLAACHGSTLDAIYPGSLGHTPPPAINLPMSDCPAAPAACDVGADGKPVIIAATKPASRTVFAEFDTRAHFLVIPAEAGPHNSVALEFRSKGNALPTLAASRLGEMDPGFRRGDQKICETGFLHTLSA